MYMLMSQFLEKANTMAFFYLVERLVEVLAELEDRVAREEEDKEEDEEDVVLVSELDEDIEESDVETREELDVRDEDIEEEIEVDRDEERVVERELRDGISVSVAEEIESAVPEVVEPSEAEVEDIVLISEEVRLSEVEEVV